MCMGDTMRMNNTLKLFSLYVNEQFYFQSHSFIETKQLIPNIGKSYKYSMGYTFYILYGWNIFQTVIGGCQNNVIFPMKPPHWTEGSDTMSSSSLAHSPTDKTVGTAEGEFNEILSVWESSVCISNNVHKENKHGMTKVLQMK